MASESELYRQSVAVMNESVQLLTNTLNELAGPLTQLSNAVAEATTEQNS